MPHMVQTQHLWHRCPAGDRDIQTLIAVAAKNVRPVVSRKTAGNNVTDSTITFLFQSACQRKPGNPGNLGTGIGMLWHARCVTPSPGRMEAVTKMPVRRYFQSDGLSMQGSVIITQPTCYTMQKQGLGVGTQHHITHRTALHIRRGAQFEVTVGGPRWTLNVWCRNMTCSTTDLQQRLQLQHLQ